MMKQLNLFIFIITVIFLSSCGTVKEGFTNQKKNNSDEFLVEKKSPLIMPPDYNELPIPKKENTDNKNNENEIKQLIIKNKNNKIEESANKNNKTFEDSLLKKIKEN